MAGKRLRWARLILAVVPLLWVISAAGVCCAMRTASETCCDQVAARLVIEAMPCHHSGPAQRSHCPHCDEIKNTATGGVNALPNAAIPAVAVCEMVLPAPSSRPAVAPQRQAFPGTSPPLYLRLRSLLI
jgi:hypothetical protein